VPNIRQLAGKMVGVSSTHSLSDMAAQLTAENHSLKFDIVTLGAGAIVPELRAGKVDAIISSALLGLREVSASRARIVFDLGLDPAPFLVSGYVASTAMIETRQRDLRAFVAATTQALAHMQADRKWSIEQLKEYARVTDTAYAERLHDNVIAKLGSDPQISPESLKEALELAARAWKQPELAATPVAPLYTNEFAAAAVPPRSQ
jgi:ABC-type nitrate/sulfonate/bicarbonate transport system substrate-binding protein